jgi:ABC-2 type transport system permease protein
MTATLTTEARSGSRPAAQPPGIPFGTLVRVEWSKATDTRAARWLLAITAVATVGITLVPILAASHIDQDFRGYVGLVSLPGYFLLPLVAILTLTSEWTQRTVLATFTQEPRRLRVVSAKLAVALTIAVVSAAGIALVSLAGLAISAAAGRAVSMHPDPSVLTGLLLYTVAGLLVGAAFGAVLQNSAAAIVLSLVLPTVVGILGGLTGVIQNWFDTGTTFGWLVDGDFGGHGAGIAVSALVWIVLPLGAGLIRTARREIS